MPTPIWTLLYEDSDLLVVEKPVGLPVETARIGAPDLVSLLKNHLAETAPGRPPYLGVVHRLDQPVQGVMVFAKNQKAAAALSAGISGNEMQKTYLAIVCGQAQEKAALTDYLCKDGRTNTSRIVPAGTKNAKKSELSYELLSFDADKNLSLVRIHLLTGRHHQIRVQMAGSGLPLYGDQKYNPNPLGKSVALCAAELTFRHPRTGKQMTFSVKPSGEILSHFAEEGRLRKRGT